MNVEALCGTVLGSCTLQKLIGRGGVGVVFLAQQTRPKRQVAVKVLLPMTTLPPSQHAAFLERFRKETDIAASLGHPNIVPVHEYGERDGLAYLVMAYISGGTLRDELEREGRLPLTKVVSYLEQMAAALDFAHQRGVVHRDIKPANILLTPEKRLLLTDFGLVKIVTDGQFSPSPLSELGMPMGTPDYMSPEQVLGGDQLDARADIYSLSVLLYHMVTGTVPFTGTVPIKVALQHLHNSPPSPRLLRPDLPIAAEQVILRAMARLPENRYSTTREFASAFRQALETAGVILDIQGNASVAQNANGERNMTGGRPRGLFDPVWRAAAQTAQPTNQPPEQEKVQSNDIVMQSSMTLPSFSGLLAKQDGQGTAIPPSTPLFSMDRIHSTPSSLQAIQFEPSSPKPEPALANGPSMVPSWAQVPNSPSLMPNNPSIVPNTPSIVPNNPSMLPNNRIPNNPSLIPNNPSLIPNNPSMVPNKPSFVQNNSSMVPNNLSMMSNNRLPNNPSMVPNNPSIYSMIPNNSSLVPNNPSMAANPQTFALLAGQGKLENNGNNDPAVPPPGATGALMVPVNEGNGQTGMLKLTQSVKVVKVPVAGQPGRYMTGLLPVLPDQSSHSDHENETANRGWKGKTKIALLITLILVIILASSVYLLGNTHSSLHLPGTAKVEHATPNVAATASANADATAQANMILTDALDHNIHGWLATSDSDHSYSFHDGAYHIANNSSNQLSIALLPNEELPDTFAYTLTTDEVKGDDTTTDVNKLNLFGLVVRFNQSADQKNYTFYCFEVKSATKNAEYQFRKYDSSLSDPWSILWHQPIGDEYHLGQGANNSNTIKVVANGTTYTFLVNGKQVGSFTASWFQHGQVGMLVNQAGAEIAFSNLLLTHS